MKEIPVFSQRLAGFLMMGGYPLQRIEPNRKRPTLHVFYFEESEGLRARLTEYRTAN
ncbi:DUF5659 domain-containing protein [Paenibacillus sp. GCM10027627]|uniref:DUF5659 domain-containing protein n=1 Tax=unclassified Paenibacillus TaxID=185978 RepID=UPI003624F461